MEDSVQQLKEKLQRENLRGLALDIDETLSNSNMHWFKHMFEFLLPEGKTKEEIIKNYKYVENVPEWNTTEAFEHMDKIIHSNEFNETIPLIENANHIVNKIHQHVPVVAYITARPASVMSGTEKWLKKHGFPEADIIMRPLETKSSKTDLVDRNIWKAKILHDLYPEVLGIVDDNIGLASELKNIKYKGTLYMYGMENKEFAGEENIIVCPTWQSVLDAIVAI